MRTAYFQACVPVFGSTARAVSDRVPDPNYLYFRYIHGPHRESTGVYSAHQSIPDRQIEADAMKLERGCRWACAPRRGRSKSVEKTQIGPPQLTGDNGIIGAL